jgi:radical SAM superfamily enzyme YgiQ (UPF0313 family)
MEERNYPFRLITEASLNLAEDDELIELLVKAGFTMVFMGIETPDVGSLVGINKEQNTRTSLIESCHKITRAGLQIMSGFILGFDNELPGAGSRIEQFVEETGIPQAQLGLLQALHNTAMWNRLQREGRLLEGLSQYFTTQKALMNFVPTRPMEEIVHEYINAFWNLYEPLPYLKRTFRHFWMMEGKRPQHNNLPTWDELRFFFAICWRQGVVRSTRFRFWWQLVAIALRKPDVFYDYFIVLGIGEHFFNFRHEVKSHLLEELPAFQQTKMTQKVGATNFHLTPVSVE